jgi:Flp pilus assembly protein CpaB
MARNRSTVLVAVGVAVFVLGTSMAFLLVHNNKTGAPAKSTAAAQTAALPARTNLAAAASTPAASAVDIPDGMEAIAVQLPLVPGVAGYVHNGDNVNIYGVFKADQPAGGLKAPMAKLALSNVKVLSVTSPAPGADNGAATYLLALTPAQAEQVVYLNTFQSLYMSLARKGAPASPTSGHNITNAL